LRRRENASYRDLYDRKIERLMAEWFAKALDLLATASKLET
jgi:hypothetical protein